MTTLLDTAIEAAKTAGEIIRAGWGQVHTVEMKGEINPVTEVDRASEAAILKILRAATPDFGILTEESGSYSGAAGARWVIDPLDGTSNYSRNFPHFAVSIGLERAGRTVLGVIFDPIREELFLVESGGGAYLGQRRIEVSRVAALADSIIATGFPYDVWETGANTAELARLARCVQTVRITGAAVLDIAYVGCGRLDAYYDRGVSPWDICAGRLLLEEAGGVMTFHGGDPLAVESQLMVAANPHVHSPLLQVIGT